MEAPFDLLSILLVVTLFQGAFVLSVLVIKHSLRSAQHLLLFLMVLILMWFQAEFLAVRLPYNIDISLFFGTRYGAWLALGPLYYFYVLSITGERIRLKTVLIHFIPFVLFWFILPLLTTDMVGKQQVTYGMLSTFYGFKGMKELQYVYAALFIIQFLHVLVYLFFARGIIAHYERELKGSFSKINLTTIFWLKLLNRLLITVVGFVTIFLGLFFVFGNYNRDLDYLYVMPMAIIVYLISYRLAGVEWTARPVDESPVKYERTALKPDQAQQIRTQLEIHMSKSKPYLNNELRLQDLASQLQVAPHQLSQVINDQLNQNFFDYVNKYRVEEAKRLILSEPGATLLEIAFKAGFNNKTSFSNAFKKFTTQTAAEFRSAGRP